MQRLTLILIGVGALILVVMFFTGDNQTRLEGEVTEVRTIANSDDSSIALVNFRIENITNRPFVGYQREVEMIDAEGRTRHGLLVQEFDLQQLFKYYAQQLGGMKDEPFSAQKTVEAGDERGFLIGARFETTEAELKARQDLIIRLTDGANRTSVIRESDE